jgi:hypothetical protein
MANDSRPRRSCAPSWSPTRSSRRSLLAAALLLVCGAAAAVPDRFEARYEVSHRAITLGEARVTFERLPGARYRYSTTTQPTGITKLFYNATVTELSEGQITVNGFRPDRYVYQREGRKARSARLRFDWDDNIVINEVAGDSWKMKIPDDALDRLGSQLQLMWDLAHNERRLSYDIADGGQLKTYQLVQLGNEAVRTRFGTLDTVKIVRKRDDNARATTFWCAPSLDYLPVRIVHREKDDNFEMTLERVEGFEQKN